MNEVWIWFLHRVNAWTLRQMREAVRRQKVRWFREELARQIGWRN